MKREVDNFSAVKLVQQNRLVYQQTKVTEKQLESAETSGFGPTLLDLNNSHYHHHQINPLLGTGLPIFMPRDI